jgi:hypothetical protein
MRSQALDRAIAGAHTGAMRRLTISASVVAVVFSGACGASDAGSGSADCTQQIAYGETTYSSYGFTLREGDDLGDALLAPCDDLGGDGSGSAGNPVHVGVVRFSGHSAADVLGVPERAGRTAVFVRESMAPATRDRIFDELD